MPDRLALVPGEPAGVGPELCVRVAQQPPECGLLAFADPDCLSRAAARLGLPLRLVDPDAPGGPGVLPVHPVPQARIEQPGKPDPANARAVIDALLAGARACRSGEARALVTGPVHKASINAGGIAYTGTTELLAAEAGVDVVMMLANPDLRVALVTTHLALRDVADAITAEALERAIRITLRALTDDFGIAVPHLAVLGLNPHAGEDGVLGREEIEVITPVLEHLRAQGHRLSGPLPADTAFLPRKLTEVDAVLAMYHDQGLPVLKHSGFEHAVNITLGLPYPRVAVDHGTALDLAGRGIADPSSLQAAVSLAATLAARRGNAPLRTHSDVA
ncbi:4-hydroxythreonine-4-phosphate dehydrogenase PdxA [Alkalisalibacterium limincola]|uniref:4-hydroxythreonine-4-phosphate dehydrogenase n=1 Tax=Alkalisalibacterium limincola TaxID=2699169 RepID=A0A5C8KJ83_9GAMM|nr:4-hydroxythreonine-4-phosphate dehydrogenase PdxA [Alkalisalibacterium limincola]TXK60558.1 4-hydroxythreonine-4-phosphate dehydrogenase PdxA [Alkalisalibacterium limincola]